MKILGIDYGTKKLGLALGVSGIVTPLFDIDYAKGHILEKNACQEISKIISVENIRKVIFGIPITSNTSNKLVDDVKEFGLLLKNFYKTNFNCDIDIEYVNEVMSSKEAVERMVNMGYSQKSRKDDHIYAACIILERYFEEKGNY